MSSPAKIISDVLMAVYVRKETLASRVGTDIVAGVMIEQLIAEGWSFVNFSSEGQGIEPAVWCPPLPGDLSR